MQLSQSVQGSPAVGRHKQETVVRVQGWSGPGSDEQISVAPAWQPQGTPQKESPPLHGGKPWGWADNSNGAHSVSPPEGSEFSLCSKSLLRDHRGARTQGLAHRGTRGSKEIHSRSKFQRLHRASVSGMQEDKGGS